MLPFQSCKSCWDLFWGDGVLVPQVLEYCRARNIIFPSVSYVAEPFYQLGFLSLCQYSFTSFKENFIQGSLIFSTQTLVCRHSIVHFASY